MRGPYDDIINLPHHVSTTRKRMSMIERAAQFSPFAALTGYDAAIQETGRLTDCCIDLDVDSVAMLNEKIRWLSQFAGLQPEITVIYFLPDERKHGGAYVSTAGKVRKVDACKQKVIMEDGTEIDFSRIYDISGEILRDE